MLLQSLVNYYDILANSDVDIPKLGYSSAKVSYALNLSLDGELLEILPLKQKVLRGKKEIEIAPVHTVPEHLKKTSVVNSNFLCENSSYVLGIDNKGKEKRSKQCFEAFKKLHNNILENVKCDEATALLRFLNNWEIDKENPVLSPYLDEITSGANIVFKLDSKEYAHKCEDIKKAWEEHINKQDEAIQMQCLVTGKKAQVARLHPSIKGVANAQSSGASLVSFNSQSYESYEKLQGANSPISKVAAFKYGTVLNYMLADRQHKLKLGDSTIVYWANSEKKQYQEIANLLFAPGSINKDTKEKTVDTETEIVVRDILLKISNGEMADNVLFHDDTEFSILALSPNTSRLSVRFFIQNNFGDFLKKICKHYEDLKIEKQCKDDLDYISLSEILSQTVSPNSKDKSASPLLAGSVLKSIISGTSYPKILLNYVMLRIKAERNINYQKVAIIKAYLIRQSSKKYMEVLTMSLNKDSKNIAYLLGRLFAVLENVQYDANKSSNIKDRYFSSASSTPSTVFPTLLKLSQHHISKAEYGMNSDMMVEDILSKIDIIENPIPSNLSLEEQGVFVLGYYHQRNDFYKSK